MSERLLANVTVKVNNEQIRKETRDGRDVYVVPSKTMPRGIVMNGIHYPGEVVEDGYQTLERSPAPYGHPLVNGKFVSARDPQAINISWVGAWNEGVRYEGDRLSLNKVIDIEVANQSKQGREVINAINQRKPIHTSTGIFVDVEELPEPKVNAMGQEYQREAKAVMFDHDAILLNEQGAATPEQGVGIFVNSNQECPVVNYNLTPEEVDEVIESAARTIAYRVEEEERENRLKPLVDKIKSLLKDVLQYDQGSDAEPQVNQSEESGMTVTKEDFEAFKTEVKGLIGNAQASAKDDDTSAKLDKLTAAVEGLAANQKAQAEAEHAKAVEAVVNADLLDKDVAETMDTKALNALAEKFAKPGVAANAKGAFGGKQGKEPAFQLPDADEGDK